MNALSSKSRKLVYTAVIFVMLVPVMYLGRPAGAEKGSGGALAQMRDQYDLGEASLGDVDPSGATMNLVLLGLRGVAVDLLWMEALSHQEQKNWSQLRANVESIVLLQPHYLEVWKHQGWNLAYNVSAEWDKVSDRYYWVKEGIKFVKRGARRNARACTLTYDLGTFTGKKIGRCDEWRQFRKYFNEADPDVDAYKGKPDPEVNPDPIKDNYLVSKDWYDESNRREAEYGGLRMERVLFRHHPARAMLDYPAALQREGKYGDITRLAWENANKYLVNTFGTEEKFEGRTTDRSFQFWLEMTDEDLDSVSKQTGVPRQVIEYELDLSQKTINYRYWRFRSRIEGGQEMVDAHRTVYEGMELFRQGKYNDVEENGVVKPSEAQLRIEDGLKRFEKLFNENSILTDESETKDEVLTAIICWNYIHIFNIKDIPEQFPLKALWVREQARIPQLNSVFRYDYRIPD